MNTFTVAFFGHRTVENPREIENQLEQIIGQLLRGQEYVEFLVGRNGEFDQLAASSVRRAKQQIRSDNSALTLILPYPTAEYQNNLASFEAYYDEIEICEESTKSHFKRAIQTRNQSMIRRADLVVAWVEHPSGGAYTAMRYAKKCQKNILNLASPPTKPSDAHE